MARFVDEIGVVAGCKCKTGTCGVSTLWMGAGTCGVSTLWMGTGRQVWSIESKLIVLLSVLTEFPPSVDDSELVTVHGAAGVVLSEAFDTSLMRYTIVRISTTLESWGDLRLRKTVPLCHTIRSEFFCCKLSISFIIRGRN